MSAPPLHSTIQKSQLWDATFFSFQWKTNSFQPIHMYLHPSGNCSLRQTAKTKRTSLSGAGEQTGKRPKHTSNINVVQPNWRSPDVSFFLAGAELIFCHKSHPLWFVVEGSVGNKRVPRRFQEKKRSNPQCAAAPCMHLPWKRRSERGPLTPTPLLISTALHRDLDPRGKSKYMKWANYFLSRAQFT